MISQNSKLFFVSRSPWHRYKIIVFIMSRDIFFQYMKAEIISTAKSDIQLQFVHWKKKKAKKNMFNPSQWNVFNDCQMLLLVNPYKCGSSVLAKIQSNLLFHFFLWCGEFGHSSVTTVPWELRQDIVKMLSVICS